MTTPAASWSGIKPADVDKYWHHVAPYIARGMTGLDTLEGVKTAIEQRQAQLWAVWEGQRCLAALVTKITDHDKGRVCTIAHCGGIELCSWREHLNVLEAWAREKGCCRIDIVGRKGWERVLPGFEQTGVVLEKKL